MGGVFHSMVTQGHVSINRACRRCTAISGCSASHGLRVFVELGGAWHLLDTPSAFEMSARRLPLDLPTRRGQIDVRSEARSEPQELDADHRVVAARQCAASSRITWRRTATMAARRRANGGARRRAIVVAPAAAYERSREALPERHTGASAVERGTRFERVGGDELLFADGRSARAAVPGAHHRGARPRASRSSADWSARPTAGADSRAERHARPADARADRSPAENAAVERLAASRRAAAVVAHRTPSSTTSRRAGSSSSPAAAGARATSARARSSCCSRSASTQPMRDLLLRVMRAAEPRGDWPQWFMFFERERDIRAGDSHGDIVFWPLLALGALPASRRGDAALLDERVPFFDAPSATPASRRRCGSTSSARSRVIARARDPRARARGLRPRRLERLAAAGRPGTCASACAARGRSTLHHQTLTTLAAALRAIGRRGRRGPARSARPGECAQDFQRLLRRRRCARRLRAASTTTATRSSYLLHPSDERPACATACCR